jgi:hypothetical protein
MEPCVSRDKVLELKRQNINVFICVVTFPVHQHSIGHMAPKQKKKMIFAKSRVLQHLKQRQRSKPPNLLELRDA